MVSTPVSDLTSLASLNQAMAIHLRQQSLHPGLAVTCLEHQGRLLVLGQHRTPEVKDPAALFQALGRCLYAALATVSLEGSPWEDQSMIAVRLFLKLRAAHRPYAMHTLTWRLADTAAVLFPVTNTPATDNPATDNLATDNPIHPATSPSELPHWTTTNPSATEVSAYGSADGDAAGGIAQVNPGEAAVDDPSSAPQMVQHWGQEPDEPCPESDGVGLGATSLALALWGDPNDEPLGEPDPPGPDILGLLSQGLRDYWSYGVAGVILVSSGLFAVALTRPCVVGRCERLAEAQAYYGQAQETLAFSPSATDLNAAQGDLQRAIDRLAPIPSWSGAYEAAQVDLQRYRQELRAVQAILQAKTTAARAADLSQNPPHTVERWVTIHQLWRQAIDQLETVPDTSPAYDYAQKKRSEYRTNHSAIGRRIVAEEEAEANFNTAIQTGILAQQRMETASSLAGWQLAIKEWQAAIKGLSLIPQGTLIYEQAQAQMREYQQHLHRTTHQGQLENASAHNYDQAIRAARAAAAYEAQGQWSLAVNHWQRAVASAQQIPLGTVLAEEGALLLETYEPALLNAQGRLRGAVAIQSLTTTLGTICSEVGGSCTVREDPTQVKITLATPHAEALRQAITPVAADGTFGFTQTLTPQTQSLIEQVTTLSHQVNRQVAIYDSQGGFVARYRPDVGGFVRN
ncbi:hypothetical protein GFS31_36050 [Leptolyngbya sp. BL0902]|uniref:hypothetical protein n=1 Tax=Leptolyngbya sp. BL0902 TaxID=1115757 RepID=UPI0018E82895|nr:hypothetical protein [Leptolyngbya sp. BL0902]QQE66901.1 hypothetical protein GFS31_36050 [Leptolyngbya sp. BL0902]